MSIIAEGHRAPTREDTIECIAVDGKQHVCYPWSDVTYCEEALKVTQKNPPKRYKEGRFSCWECTY